MPNNQNDPKMVSLYTALVELRAHVSVHLVPRDGPDMDGGHQQRCWKEVDDFVQSALQNTPEAVKIEHRERFWARNVVSNIKYVAGCTEPEAIRYSLDRLFETLAKTHNDLQDYSRDRVEGYILELLHGPKESGSSSLESDGAVSGTTSPEDDQ